MTISNTTIQIKKSGTTGNKPTSLNYGELALNYYDGKLFYKDAAGNISYFYGANNGPSFATANANNNLILASTPNDTLSLNAANGISITACTTSKTITISDATTFTLATGAYNGANSAGSYANSAYAAQNTTGIYANSAYAAQNTTGTYANAAFLQANSAYAAANAAGGSASAAAFTQANSAFLAANNANANAITSGAYANAAFSAANAAFSKANTSSNSITYTRNSFTANVGQTLFTTSYTVDYLQVYVNGVLLSTSDYTATNGSSFTLNVAANMGDIVEAAAFSSGSYTRNSFTATGGQTLFTSTYVVGQLQVYVNGVLLSTSDYTATNGSSFTLSVAANAGDLVEAINVNLTSNSTFASITTGNLTFTGTGNRITGDFSNATAASRVAIQTSTTNGNTNLEVIPNGTATRTDLVLNNAADPTNASLAQMFISNAEMRLISNIRGTGTYLPMTFYTGGSERMRLDTSGNLLVGITSGSYKFMVGDGTRDMCINPSSFLDGIFIGTIQAKPLVLGTTNSERMRIDSNGNVGIGTSSPSTWATRLTVQGTAAILGNASLTGSNPTYQGSFRLIENPTTIASTGGIEFLTSSFGSGYGWKMTSLDSSGVQLTFATRQNSATWTEVMRLDSASNVVIGNSVDNNTRVLNFNSVSGGSSSIQSITVGATNQALTFSTTFATLGERMRITGDGNVGIGTSSPGGKLEVSSSGQNIVISRSTGSYAAFQRVAPTGQQTYDFYTINGVEVARITGDPSYLSFATGSAATERMRIDSSGNVGIGTNSPSYKLDVVGTGDLANRVSTTGTSNAASIILQSGSGTTSGLFAYARFLNNDTNAQDWRIGTYGTNNLSIVNAKAGTVPVTVDTSGNVGIGTSAPAQKLQVTGKAIVGSYANTGAYGLYLRSDALSTHYNWQISTQNTIDGGFEIARSDAVGSSTFNSPSLVIDSSGNLLVGATSQFNSGKQCIAFNGTTNYGISLKDGVDQATARFIGFINGSGTVIGSVDRVTTTNAVVYNTTSDYRLKTVTGTVTGQGARIDSLKPIDYLWTEGGQQARGFLAHEFQEVYSNSVTGEKDAVDADGNPKYQAMQAGSSEVIADLVAEIQSLRKRLAALESR